jgi:hypothetical protein
MAPSKRSTRIRSYEVWPGELRTLWIESILLGTIVMAAVQVIGLKLFPHLPDAIRMGLGFSAPGFVLYPTMKIYLREKFGRELSFIRLVAWSLAGGVAGGIAYTIVS